MGETVDEDPDRPPQGVARAPSAEAEDLRAVVELEGRPDPFQSVGELRGPETAGAAQEEPRRELGDPVRIALRDHAGWDAPAERDERVRREGIGDQDGPVPEGGAVGELQPVPSWAWNRTRDRCSSTRYVRATSRMRSGGTDRASSPAARRHPSRASTRRGPDTAGSIAGASPRTRRRSGLAIPRGPWRARSVRGYRRGRRTGCAIRWTASRRGLGGRDRFAALRAAPAPRAAAGRAGPPASTGRRPRGRVASPRRDRSRRRG